MIEIKIDTKFTKRLEKIRPAVRKLEKEIVEMGRKKIQRYYSSFLKRRSRWYWLTCDEPPRIFRFGTNRFSEKHNENSR